MGQTSTILRLFLQRCDFEESSSGILKRVHLSPFHVSSAFLGHKNHETRFIYFFKRKTEIWLSIYRIPRPMALRWHEIPWDLWYVSFRAGKAVENPIDCQTGKRLLWVRGKSRTYSVRQGFFWAKHFAMAMLANATSSKENAGSVRWAVHQWQFFVLKTQLRWYWVVLPLARCKTAPLAGVHHGASRQGGSLMLGMEMSVILALSLNVS